MRKLMQVAVAEETEPADGGGLPKICGEWKGETFVPRNAEVYELIGRVFPNFEWVARIRQDTYPGGATAERKFVEFKNYPTQGANTADSKLGRPVCLSLLAEHCRLVIAGGSSDLEVDDLHVQRLVLEMVAKKKRKARREKKKAKGHGWPRWHRDRSSC